jgi:hypothetical protein
VQLTRVKFTDKQVASLRPCLMLYLAFVQLTRVKVMDKQVVWLVPEKPTRPQLHFVCRVFVLVCLLLRRMLRLQKFWKEGGSLDDNHQRRSYLPSLSDSSVVHQGHCSSGRTRVWAQ